MASTTTRPNCSSQLGVGTDGTAMPSSPNSRGAPSAIRPPSPTAVIPNPGSSVTSEIANRSTGGTAQTFKMNNYTITSS